MGYRRFIAYVYEYRKGKKEDNCGFMKVEVRNHMCTIEPHLQVGNLAAGEVCKVYGFVRKEGLMNGILLGSCKTEANRIECLVETDGMDMGGSGIPLEKMGGMILLTESGGFFGTEWDDQTIRPENFKESIIKKEETGTVCEIIKEKAEEKLENESKPETDSTPDLDDRHEVEDVVEQMQDDLLEAEEMISDEPQAKDEPTVGEIWEAEQKITCRVNTKQEEKEKTIALPFGQPVPRQRSEPVLENYTPGSGPFSKKTMRPSQQPFFAIRILQFRTSPSVPQIKWPVHTWCTRKLRPAGTVYGRHVRLFLLQRKQLYQGEKRQGRVLVPCD